MSALDLSSLTLVTIGFNSADVLKEHYATIDYEQIPIEYRPQYILVDNASSDDTRHIMEQNFPWVNIISSRDNLGYGGGANLGIKAAQTRFVMVLNPDTQLCISAFYEMMSALKDDSHAAMAGPDVHKSKQSGREYVDWVIGAAIMLDCEKMDSIGYFDESYFLFFEETDLCYRVLEKGFKILHCHDAKMPHEQGASSKSFSNRDLFLSYHWGRSYRIISQKFPERLSSLDKQIRRLKKSVFICKLTRNSKRERKAKAKILGMKGEPCPVSPPK